MEKIKIITTLIAGLYFTTGEAQSLPAVPRLVVNITIDQLRTDYMEAFSPLYGSGGFKKLFENSRVYTQAQYPSSRLDRASAVATVSTGATPYDNGIVGIQWLDRETLRPVMAVDDNDCEGVMTLDKYSPRRLAVSTIGDELKVATSGKSIVYAIAPFGEEALFGAGHAADGAFWIDNASGQWSSTSYYGQYPDWALRYDVSDRLSGRISDLSWTPISPIVENFNFFISPQESKGFTHKFTGDRKIYEFKTSAYVNDEVNRFAKHCLDHTELGEDLVTDFLSLTYYAGTFDHKPVAEVPVELQDTYVRLDLELAELITMLEKKVGAGRFLLVVTSTGYTDDEITDFSKYRIPTGTFSVTRASALLNMYLMAVYGQGQYVETEFGSQLFLNQKLIEDKQLNLSDVLTRAQAFLIQMAGVKDVYTSQRLALSAGETEIRRLRNSFNQMRSGDIFIEVSPGWKVVNEETHEQTLERASYVGFPIFFFGCNVRPETIKTPVTVDCIAPTVARFMRIRAPNACSAAPLSAVR